VNPCPARVNSEEIKTPRRYLAGAGGRGVKKGPIFHTPDGRKSELPDLPKEEEEGEETAYRSLTSSGKESKDASKYNFR